MKRAPTPFLIAWTALLAAHAAWLRLPYYWDEAGYFVPAALDFFRHGWLTPRSTLANGHPPLLSICLAAAWRLAGFHPAVTRIAMLAWAALAVAGIYRLGCDLYGRRAGAAAALLFAAAPVAFSQSMLAQLDMPATALLIWALLWRRRERPWLYAACAAAACLTKETTAIVPLALACLDAVRLRRPAALWPHAVALTPLVAWLVYFHAATGFWLGEPGYLAYNLGGGLHSLPRIGLALVRHAWQLAAYGGVGLLLLAGWRRGKLRVFEYDLVVLVGAYLLFHSLVGGAVLARYLLPAQAALFLLLAPGWMRLSMRWSRPHALVAICLAWLAVNWFWNPPYPFPYEDNLAWVQFVRLHRAAARAIVSQPGLVVTTAWPATDELRDPDLGYVARPVPVRQIEDFSPAALDSLSPPAGALLLYSRQYQPHEDFSRLPFWWHWSQRYFGAQPQAPPSAWLDRLHLTSVFHLQARGQWITLAAPP